MSAGGIAQQQPWQGHSVQRANSCFHHPSSINACPPPAAAGAPRSALPRGVSLCEGGVITGARRRAPPPAARQLRRSGRSEAAGKGRGVPGGMLPSPSEDRALDATAAQQPGGPGREGCAPPCPPRRAARLGGSTKCLPASSARACSGAGGGALGLGQAGAQ